MKSLVILLSFILSVAQAQGQLLRDDFSRAATTDIAGSMKWRRVLNLNDTSSTIQLNADSTVSPRNLLGPFNRGAAYWDSALSGRFQVGMVLRHKNGNDGIPSFHLHVMNDSSWTTGNGYAMRYQANPGQDRMDIQRITGSGTDTPTVNLLATLNREFAEGDTLFFKFTPDGRKTAVVYGAGGSRDSISVVDTFYNPASWFAWIQGRVFADPIRMDNFMLGPIPFPITAAAGPGGSISPSGTVLVDPGDSAAFTITPDPGFFIVDVVVDTTSVGAVGGYTFPSVDAAHTITATFDTAEYTVTATAGPNGTITPSGAIGTAGGSNLSFTIAPDAGYHVDSVVVDGANQGAPTGYEFTNIVANHSIAAYFSINTYGITASASPGGTVSPSGLVSVTHGDSAAFVVAPAPGFHIDSVVVDGANLGAVANHTFTNVTANHAIAAYFSVNTYAISATASAGGSITPSGTVNVNHGDSAAFAIVPDAGFHVDSVVVDGANLGAVAGHTFTNVTANHAIAAYFSVNTYAISATASAGGSITPSGTVNVNHGDSAAFAIVPDAGFHVDSVVVDGANLGAVTNHTFTNVTANHAIAAYFSVNKYLVAASASAGGTISPSGSVIVTHGDSAAFTITPDAGYHADSVIVDGVNLGALANHTFTNVTANHTIAAHFSVNTYSVTATASAGGSIAPSGTVTVNHGDSAAFVVTPDAGRHTDSVVVDGVNLGAVAGHTFTNVTANHAIAAYFSINTYSVTATASAGGSIAPSGTVTVNHGDSAAFVVTPDAGRHVDSVVVDGVNLGAVAGHTFANVTANHAIAAFFSINSYTVTATASPGGSISPQGPQVVAHGDTVSFSIAPDTGHHVDSVVVDGVNLGAVTSHAFTNVTANHAIAAYFSINVYTIAAGASSGGAIFPFGAVGVVHGGDTSFTITPNTGSHIDSVVVDGVNQGVITSYAFTDVAGNHSIQAYFSTDAFTITASASAGGNISPSGAVAASYGSNRAFTVTPTAGYHIDSVVVDGVNQGAVAGYTFINVTADHAISAWFSINTYAITATAGPGGSISPSGVTLVDHGGDRSFTIDPDPGFHVDSVVVDGVNQGAIAGHTFTGVTGPHAISAWFSINTYTITATAGPNGAIAPAGATTVAHGDSVVYAITPDTGYYLADVRVDSVSIGAVGTYTFTGVSADHTIEAFFSITPYTILASATAGGTISPSGIVGVNFGDDTTFTVTPAAGHHVDSVVVDGVNQGAIAFYSFADVAANHAIAAYFSIDVFTITASASAGGSVSPSGAVGAPYGSSPSFTITPDSGRHVDSVLVDGVNVGAPTAWTFTNVAANHSIAAYFSVDLFTVTAVQAPNGSITPAGASIVPWGGSISYDVVADTGYYVADIHVDTVSVGPAASYTFTDVRANHTITPTFAIRTFTVTSSASAGGSVSPPGAVTAEWGDTVTVSITADPGRHIDSVVVDGVNVGTPAQYSFPGVTADHALAAYFSVDVFTIAATAGAGGSISPAGAVTVAWGEDRAFTVTPDTGYRVDSVLVDGANVGAQTAWTFTNVTAAHTIQAFFSLRTFTVFAAAGGGGAISPVGATGVTWGDSLAFTITPDPGYHVDSVVVDGVNLGILAGYVFRDIRSDHVIEAHFSETAFTITASAGAGGSIAPSGAVGVAYGGTALFTMTPAPGHHVDSVLVDGVNVGAVTSYRFLGVLSDRTIVAYFSVNYYSLTASAGPGGTITPSGTLSLVHGSSQAFVIAPSTGYRILDVLVDGVSVGQEDTVSLTNLSADHTVTASFTKLTFDVSATAGPNGSVAPAGVTTVAYGDSIVYTITPDPGFYIQGVAVDGIAVGPVGSYTFRNVTAPHAISATFTSNATPTAFGLVSPADGVSVPPTALAALRFTWRRSFDANPGDVLSYVVSLNGPGVNFNSFQVTDTTVALDLRGLALVNLQVYRWTVTVSDGAVSVASPDTFDIIIDPTTGVGDGPGALPKAYALGQNYPNPFNPTTAVPFDLPERSEVTIRIYDVIGAGVMTLAAGESLPAGSYVRRAEFSGLPSGVYFCRMAATGESGATFVKVVRLVLMR